MKPGEKIIALMIICAVVAVLPGCGWLQLQPKPVPENQQVAAGVTVENRMVGGMTKVELDMTLAQLAKEQNYGPENAFFDEAGRIQGGKNGRALNTVRTAQQVMNTPANSAASTVYDAVEPVISEASLAQAVRIGFFNTPILDNSAGRITNIRLTAKLISNTVLATGQEFSFNKVTGEPTMERGFRRATIFAANGKKEEGLGGGMCQVSSTLYNAVLAAGLPVTERHPHSQPVTYVPPGKDATTFTDKDFRFVNNSRRKMIIRSFVEKDNLTVDLWALPQ